jgi:N-acetylmuramoyl-L-alanine amidase
MSTANLLQMTYPVVADYATLGSKRRPGTRIAEVKFIVAHDTGNPGASARNHARWYRNDPNPPPKLVSSAHIFVDDLDVVETIPVLTDDPEVAFHVRYSVDTDNKMFEADANSSAIGVEYCFGGTIDADAAYDRYVWVLAYLCGKFGLDPATRVVGHHVLDPGRKVDPPNGLAASARTYDGLLADVATRFVTLGGAQAAVGAQAVKVGKARATVNLNLRAAATSASNRLGVLVPGTEVSVAEVVPGESVYGNDRWCRLAQSGAFCWSGGLIPA